MKKFISAKPLYVILRLFIGGLMIYAGVLKMGDPAGFAQTIDEYGLVSWRMANLIARVLPPVEIISGIGLILDIRGALGLIVAQLLGFMAVLGYGIHLGLNIDCGCFGPADGSGESGGLWDTLIRDIGLFAICLLLYWQRRAAGYIPRSLPGLNLSKHKE